MMHRFKTYVRLAVALAGVIGVFVLAVLLPGHLIDTRGLTVEQRLKAENDIRTTLAQVAGGIVLAAGLYFTGRTWQANREGQITDRFSRAIDQLGQHEEGKLDVRLGGIFALERIARDSKRDHGPIIEILTAFLREHAKPPVLTDRATATVIAAYGGSRLRAVFQAVATVLARRNRAHDPKGLQLNLSEVGLHDVILTDAHLENANFSFSYLVGANFSGALLQHARFADAYLVEANFSRAQMDAADLAVANLEMANIENAKLPQAILANARLGKASLIGADLRFANLRDADLRFAKLKGADLRNAVLLYAKLDGATFDYALLEGADIRNTLLAGPIDAG